MKLALAGDTMLGRAVAEQLEHDPSHALFSPEIVDAVREADAFVLNLECCVSDRGAPGPGRVFHFRAPPLAADLLAQLGVHCVTLANNHALDFGRDALVDTLGQLERVGIQTVGAGVDVDRARAVVVLEARGFRLAVVALTDHPVGDAADQNTPGVAYADLPRDPLPGWVAQRIAETEADAVLVTPHWGPNMKAAPVSHVRATARALVETGATIVAGHSAHVFHGVAPRVLYDLGDFVDDYRVDRKLRNDLGLLFVVDLAGDRLEAIPLKLEFTRTRVAIGDEAAWIRRRFRSACAPFGVEVGEERGRLVLRWR